MAPFVLAPVTARVKLKWPLAAAPVFCIACWIAFWMGVWPACRAGAPTATAAVRAATASAVKIESLSLGMRMSVLPLLWLPFRDGHRSPVQLGTAVDRPDDRVLHEVLVVPVRVVVRPSVCPAALLACEPGNDHAVGELEQEAQLERLRQVGVEDSALVVDDHALVSVA